MGKQTVHAVTVIVVNTAHKFHHDHHDNDQQRSADGSKERERCVESVTSSSSESRSEKMVHGCPKCGLKFKSERACRGHMAWHSSARLVRCNVCKIMFMRKGELRRHIRREHTLVCNGCGKRFTKAWAKWRHMEAVCDVCGIHFSSARSKKYHIKMRHGGGGDTPLPPPSSSMVEASATTSKRG